MRGKAVSQSVGVNFFGNSCFFTHGFDDPLNAALTVSGIKIFDVSCGSTCAERSRSINLFNISVLISIK